MSEDSATTKLRVVFPVTRFQAGQRMGQLPRRVCLGLICEAALLVAIGFAAKAIVRPSVGVSGLEQSMTPQDLSSPLCSAWYVYSNLHGLYLAS